MAPVSEQTKNDRKIFILVMGALIALAWLVLWAWGQSPYGRFLSHEVMSEESHGASPILLIFTFVTGWTLMSAAMMLPTSLPLVTLFRTLVHRRRDRTGLVALLIAGYLSVWTLFGVVVHLGDWGLHHTVEQLGWLQANAWVIGAATLLLAGVYQFTPLKYYCLDRCRAPLSFIVEHWRGQAEQAQAFRLGVHHGMFCLGCCWSLMLLMFAVGIGNVGWMLALGTMMAAEKNMPWGRRLSAPLGVVLVGWGVSVTIGSILTLQ